MHLLCTADGRLRHFSSPRSLPPGERYAILSHVWSDDGEQSFQELKALIESGGSLRKASAKVREFCRFARSQGYHWVWIDSCCIDKTSSAELSEAINAMYRWYADAHVCYAYLADVSDQEDPRRVSSTFRRSKWFTRGWTLQELIAPRFLVFLSKTWTVIGTKSSLARTIEEVTGVDRDVLTFAKPLEAVSVARRMSWAAGRQTSRLEDEAYSLMGIFGVYMPTIYGEGYNAFVRLQEEILRHISDQSLFVWGEESTSLTPLILSPRPPPKGFPAHDLSSRNALEILQTPLIFGQCHTTNWRRGWELSSFRCLDTRIQVMASARNYPSLGFPLALRLPEGYTWLSWLAKTTTDVSWPSFCARG
ncbi:HET-domain-containing protein [Trametes cingulata]|nr:HET-domain-containing protein [Trametes cingulata]